MAIASHEIANSLGRRAATEFRPRRGRGKTLRRLALRNAFSSRKPFDRIETNAAGRERSKLPTPRLRLRHAPRVACGSRDCRPLSGHEHLQCPRRRVVLVGRRWGLVDLLTADATDSTRKSHVRAHSPRPHCLRVREVDPATGARLRRNPSGAPKSASCTTSRRQPLDRQARASLLEFGPNPAADCHTCVVQLNADSCRWGSRTAVRSAL